MKPKKSKEKLRSFSCQIPEDIKRAIRIECYVHNLTLGEFITKLVADNYSARLSAIHKYDKEMKKVNNEKKL